MSQTSHFLKSKQNIGLIHQSLLAILLINLAFFANAGILKRKKKAEHVACPKAVRHGTNIQQVCLTGGTIVCPKVVLRGVTYNSACRGLVTICPQTASSSANLSADCDGVTNVLQPTAEESGECTDYDEERRCVSAKTCEIRINEENERVKVCRQCTTTTSPVSATSDDDDDDDDDDDSDGDSSSSTGGSGSTQ